jgi:hypothetical protein
MRAMPEGYQRKGKPLMFQFDFDAVEMLYELAPTRKSIGRYLSELVRRDYIRRQEWQQRRDVQQAAVVEVAAP